MLVTFDFVGVLLKWLNIDHGCHLGGFVFGRLDTLQFKLGILLFKNRNTLVFTN